MKSPRRSRRTTRRRRPGGWGGRAGRKRGSSPPQVGADEVPAPEQAVAGVARRKAVREATAQPQLGERQPGAGSLVQQHRSHLHGGDPASEALGLTQQLNGGRAKQEKVAVAVAPEAPLIDHAAQGVEQLRRAVHLIDHQQLAAHRPQVGIRILQPLPVRHALQIQVHRGGRILRHQAPGQGRLSHLTRSQQQDRRCAAQGTLDVPLSGTWNPPIHAIPSRDEHFTREIDNRATDVLHPCGYP